MAGASAGALNLLVIGSDSHDLTGRASVLMVASSIAKASVWDVSKVNVWFIGVLVAVLLLVTYVPVTGMGLVQLFYR